jgi:hypothetical protein
MQVRASGRGGGRSWRLLAASEAARVRHFLERTLAVFTTTFDLATVLATAHQVATVSVVASLTAGDLRKLLILYMLASSPPPIGEGGELAKRLSSPPATPLGWARWRHRGARAV